MNLLGNILTPSGVLNESVVEIDDCGVITAVGAAPLPSVLEDFSGCLIVPGFIDIHIHGGGGADFMDGTVEAARTIARVHASYGTTTMLATTLTGSKDKIDAAILAAVEVIEAPGDDEARIVGIHLEGPYICAKRRGAQPLDAIREPSIDEMAHWIELSGGRITKVTMAPEIPGALDFIRWAVSRGIIVSLGHTDAISSEVESAIASGATHATHLFNAMSPMTHRSPGAVGTLLAADQITAELICDGVHIAPTVVKVAVAARGTDRIILITDAMSGASMPDGIYQLGGQKVTVHAGTAQFDDGTLAGSVLTMNRAFDNVLKFADVTVQEASAMSSRNAAAAIGLADVKGVIEVGRDADLAVISTVDGHISAVIRGGNFIFRSSI